MTSMYFIGGLNYQKCKLSVIKKFSSKIRTGVPFFKNMWVEKYKKFSKFLETKQSAFLLWLSWLWNLKIRFIFQKIRWRSIKCVQTENFCLFQKCNVFKQFVVFGSRYSKMTSVFNIRRSKSRLEIKCIGGKLSSFFIIWF